MKRLLASAAIGVAMCTAPLAAQVDPDEIATVVASDAGYTPACPDITWSEMNQVLNPDASRSPFVIPKGAVFVITGANWAGYYPEMALEVNIRNVTSGATEVAAFVPGENLSGTTDYAVGSLMITPGVVSGNGTVLCTRLRHGTTTSNVPSVRIYGYFAKTANNARAKASPIIGR